MVFTITLKSKGLNVDGTKQMSDRLPQWGERQQTPEHASPQMAPQKHDTAMQ